MLKEGRPGLTEEQKADMWRRWKAGYSIREICQALKRNSSPVYQQLAIRGGIAPSGRIRAVVLEDGGARGDLPRFGLRGVGSLDCQTLRSRALDGEPGGRPARRPRTLSGQSR